MTTGANVTVAAGQTLTLNRGRQTAAGTLTVNGSMSALQGWESIGVLRITGGSTPGQLTVAGAPLVLGGGSRTYIGANAAGQRGGTINLGGGTLELNGGLLVNNGDFIAIGNGGIHNGTVNVNYGGLAKGSGYYDAVNVTDGGKFAPGNSITDSGIGTLTLNSGSVYEFEINLANGVAGGGGTTPPQGWDRLSMNRMNVNSTPESPAIIQLVSRNAADTGPGTLPDFDPAQSYRWQAFQGEVFSGFAPDKFTFDTTQFANLTDPNGVGTFALERSGSSVFVTYTPVPEPGLMVAIAVVGLVAGRMVRGQSEGTSADGTDLRRGRTLQLVTAPFPSWRGLCGHPLTPSSPIARGSLRLHLPFARQCRGRRSCAGRSTSGSRPARTPSCRAGSRSSRSPAPRRTCTGTATAA